MLMDVGGILSRVGAIVDFSLGSQRDFSGKPEGVKVLVTLW